MTIGRRLRLLREAKGLSQGDVERSSGLLRSYISRVEGGYTAPSLATLDKFAKALGMESYQLLFSRGGKPRSPLIPRQPSMTKQMRRLAKLYDGMSSSNRKLLLSVATKLSKS